jgi:GNAT superfamily N-acetyltransferase
MSVRARKADQRDLESLVAFTLAEAREAEGRTQDHAVVQHAVRAGLEDPSLSTYWVVETEDGAVVGSASVVREWSDWNAGHYWWIQSMFIEPAFRGRGLMKRLLEAVVTEARRHGAIELRLYVHENNHGAIHAYERVGFSAAPYLIMRTTL